MHNLPSWPPSVSAAAPSKANEEEKEEMCRVVRKDVHSTRPKTSSAHDGPPLLAVQRSSSTVVDSVSDSFSKRRQRGHGICRAASVSVDNGGFLVPSGSSGRRDKQAQSESNMVPVTLHVYDLSWLTKFFQLPVFHLGVEVHHREYSFGTTDGGIVSGKPGADCRAARKREAVPLGYTLLSVLEVHTLLKQLSAEWPASSYDVLRRNCVTFAVTLCRHLGVERQIPPEYTRFAELGGTSIGGRRSSDNCRTLAPVLSCTMARPDQDSNDGASADLLEAEQSGVVKVVPLHMK